MTATPEQMQRALEYAAGSTTSPPPTSQFSALAAIIDGDAREAALREEVARLTGAIVEARDYLQSVKKRTILLPDEHGDMQQISINLDKAHQRATAADEVLSAALTGASHD